MQLWNCSEQKLKFNCKHFCCIINNKITMGKGNQATALKITMDDREGIKLWKSGIKCQGRQKYQTVRVHVKRNCEENHN